jgi:hypothetical protein
MVSFPYQPCKVAHHLQSLVQSSPIQSNPPPLPCPLPSTPRTNKRTSHPSSSILAAIGPPLSLARRCIPLRIGYTSILRDLARIVLHKKTKSKLSTRVQFRKNNNNHKKQEVSFKKGAYCVRTYLSAQLIVDTGRLPLLIGGSTDAISAFSTDAVLY